MTPFRKILLAVSLLLAGGLGVGAFLLTAAPSRGSLVMVVMDPLSSRLACACVKGYAQRDYEKLAAHLGRTLGQPVKVVYGEALDKAIRAADASRIALIIGKHSVVKADARLAGIQIHPIASLTGKEGTTTLTGLFIVKRDDPAKSVQDLKERPVLFGPSDSDEKHSAAIATLRAAGIEVPAKTLTRPGCIDTGTEVQDCTNTPAVAGVISSYALPLLEGCGSIEPGTLRVVGKTGPVPFITAFSAGPLGARSEAALKSALLAMAKDPALLVSMESKSGFIPWDGDRAEWPGWRGAGRDGHAAWLPSELPANPRVVWKRPTASSALAGVAVADGVVLAADRDLLDTKDVFLGLRASDGEPLWRIEYPAPGRLDYGQSARATPIVCGDQVFLLGAFGHLRCVDLFTGKELWKRQLAQDFGAKVPKWGWCSAPLVVGEKLIVNPGAPEASLVALDRFTGQVIWKTRGGPAAYAAFILAELGGRRQIVGYDAISLGGWDPETGRRLWTLVPPSTGDFNVPTPLPINGQLLVATENNGTRLYGFTKDGVILPKPVAENRALAPDSSSPVVIGGRVVGCTAGLFVLDPANGLRQVWASKDEGFQDFATLLGSGDRLLAVTFRGDAILYASAPDGLRTLSRIRLSENDSELYAHPALAAHRLYVRESTALVCLDLDGP